MPVLSLLLSFLVDSTSYASQVSTRSIQQSSSAVGATATSYLVTFTPVTTGAQSLVIDFCGASSIIGAACTGPTGFVATSVGFTAGTGTSSWTLGTTGASTVKLTKGAGAALGTSAISFTLTNLTNPTGVGSFYARVYTYADTAYGAGSPYSSPTSIGNNVDYGGFALSTATVISLTATVMETLSFCTSLAAPGTGCSGTTTPTLTLGHGSPATIDSTQVDTAAAYTQISTNANSGAVVAMKTNNTCSGLSRDGGTTCGVPGKGSFGTIPALTADFGLLVANGTGGTGTVTANANYGPTAANYGMGTNVTTTYGDPIESSSGACANMNSLLTFAAQAATTTPAGVYTANETLIATGTF